MVGSWTAVPGRGQDGPVVDDTDSREVSRILSRAEAGEAVDFDALLPLVYSHLHGIAALQMRGERTDHTLDPTALVHESYLKLLGQNQLGWESKAHFYAAAAEAMRRILIDHARGKGRVKRGAGRVQLPLDVVELAKRENLWEILSVDEALCRLEKQDERMGQIVKLRFFAGLSEQETAKALGITDRTVRREWVIARAWLQRHLGEE